MVTNLPMRAKVKWAEVVAAKDPREKIRLMREFLALCPKHKGTEKLIAQVKRRISILEEEIERRKTVRRRSRHESFFVEKTGDVQVVIAGFTNSGRSSLLSALTNAKPRVSGIPFTTLKPTPGMLVYEGVEIQLVEAPPIVEGSSEGRMNGLAVLSLIRSADGLILALDLSADPLSSFRKLEAELKNGRILIEEPRGYVEIERTSTGGIRVVGGGRLVDCTVEDVRRLLAGYRIHSALVRVHGEATLDDVEDAVFGAYSYKPTLIVGCKLDLPGARENLSRLREALRGRLPVIGVSTVTGEGLDLVGPTVMKALKLIRVYTKKPGRRFHPKPIVVREGSTLAEVAEGIHTELKEKFRFARVWSSRDERVKGLRVGLSYILRDGDIVEIHGG